MPVTKKRLAQKPLLLQNHTLYDKIALMKKLLLLLPLFIVLAACSNTTTYDDTSPLRIGLMPTMDSVAIATAYELGFFAELRLEIELIPFSSARDRDAAFIAGALDGATVDLIAVGLFNEGGFPARATSITTAHFTLIGQSNYQNMIDLNNKTVLISNNTAIDFVLDQMLVYYELPHDYLIRTEVGNIPARFEMVRTGGAEAALISEPFATMAVADGLSVITDTFQIDFNPFALAFTLDVVENRHADLQAFYVAYNQAVDYLNNNPIETHLDVIIDLIGFPEAIIDYITLPTFLRAQVPTLDIAAIAHEWLIGRDLINPETEIENFIFEVR